MITSKSTVFSGIQPSSNLTIGNYLGAIKQWKNMQIKYRCIYCIADLHAMTERSISGVLNKSVLDTLAILLATGINPKKCIIFAQSHVPEHVQMFWLLSCYCTFNEIRRVPQFKNKMLQSNASNITVGSFNYPIMMAADVLLYKTDIVPVGNDQKPHIDLIRNIAVRFNKLYGNTFRIPRANILLHCSKIMSLSNPKRKMSKSDPDHNSYIALLDNTNIISKKIFKAVTDSEYPPVISYNPKNKAGISNLLEIISGCTNKSIADIESCFVQSTYEELKTAVIDTLIETLSNIQKKYNDIRKDSYYLNYILKKGANLAKHIAFKTLKEIYEAVGLL